MTWPTQGSSPQPSQQPGGAPPANQLGAGGRIYVSRSTVKTHVARAMTKLGARDRAQLVVFAYEAGLARPGWAS